MSSLLLDSSLEEEEAPEMEAKEDVVGLGAAVVGGCRRICSPIRFGSPDIRLLSDLLLVMKDEGSWEEAVAIHHRMKKRMGRQCYLAGSGSAVNGGDGLYCCRWRCRRRRARWVAEVSLAVVSSTACSGKMKIWEIEGSKSAYRPRHFAWVRFRNRAPPEELAAGSHGCRPLTKMMEHHNKCSGGAPNFGAPTV
ncbi:hypothetical protein ACLOJK_034692 [Asimina triloba]